MSALDTHQTPHTMSRTIRPWLASALLTVMVLACCAATASAQVTFSRQTLAGPFPECSVSGDFDRDGRPDIAVVDANDTNGTLTIYRNLGAGKFSKVFAAAVVNGQDCVKIEAADVNGDGKLDLVVGEVFQPEVQVWSGNGNATFSFVSNQPTSTNDASDFKLADVNRDGKVDLLVRESSRDESDFGDIAVSLNDGAGNFTFHGFVSTVGAQNWAVADFDGDGKQDVLVHPFHGPLQEFSGDGNGNFTLHATSAVAAGGGNLTIGSFNRDSRLDVALHLCLSNDFNCTNPNKLFTYVNDGTGHFSLASTTSVGSQRGVLTSGDLNGDTVQDVAMSQFNGVNPTAAQSIPYVLNTGTAHFSTPHSLGSVAGQTNVFIRDMNLDGRHDVVLTASSGTIIFRNTNAPVICAPPGSATLNSKFCGLANGGTVAKTFTVKGSANSPAGVARLELWLDGKKQFEVWNDQLQRSLTVGAGKHRVSLVAVDRFGATAAHPITVTAH